jgi:hypothetical protein
MFGLYSSLVYSDFTFMSRTVISIISLLSFCEVTVVDIRLSWMDYAK